jgi:chromosome segregation ATPase
MAPKKKKGSKNAEELERLAREQEERERLEALVRLEKEAEEFQRRENEERDAAEYREKKRLKKEAQQKLIAEKDSAIASLSGQLSTLQSAFTAERAELEDELQRKQQLCDSLQNELSAQRSEGEETLQRILQDRDDLAIRAQRLEQEVEEAQTNYAAAARRQNESENQATGAIGSLRQELDKALDAKASAERDMTYRIHSLEREVEKLTSINKTLQEVIEAREADDRKNVTLMQLLNNQLDENKRRHQELLDEERLRAKKLQQDLALLETSNRQLTEDKAQLETEVQRARDQSERDIAEYKSKVDQLKFDAKYLAAELQQYKTQLQQAQQESVSAKTDAASEVHDAKLNLETATKKVEELEALVRRKDREHFDKVTFLNAQVSNNRTIINQLQQRLSKEREERVTEVSSVATELDRKANTVQTLHDDIEKRKVAAGEVEMKLNADIAILKTTVFQLQSALVDRERELESVSASKDEEVKRLRSKLDEHFIPHRNDVEESQGTTVNDNDLHDKIAGLQRELEAKSKANLESEARLKAQIANQNHIIESMQAEQQKASEENDAQVRELKQEVSRLRTTLDMHSISYRK